MTVVRDPRLLPYYLTASQAAGLCAVSTRTVADYCRRGVWQRGLHWTRPRGAQRRFLRDALIAWIEGRERMQTETSTPAPTCRANLARSPELQAAIERERWAAR